VRSKRVWKRLLGVEHTVVDDVFVDEATDAIVALVRPTRSRRGRCGICGCKRPGYDQGEGRRRWRALDLGVVQAFVEADAPRVACQRMAWSWRRCRGRGTGRASPARSRTPRRGLRSTPRGWPWLSCCASGGARSGGSASGWPPSKPGAPTGSLGCAGSVSTRSPTAKASGTSPSWSTTLPAGWCGRRRAVTSRPWTGSWTPSAPSAAPGSSWSAPTRPAGSPTWSRAAARPRGSA